MNKQNIFIAIGIVFVISSVACVLFIWNPHPRLYFDMPDPPPEILMTQEVGSDRLVSATQVQLIARAEKQQYISVTVGLDIETGNYNLMTDEEIDQEREAISNLQDTVLDQLDAPLDSNKIATIPFMQLTLDPDDVRRLLALPEVVHIQENFSVGHGAVPDVQ